MPIIPVLKRQTLEDHNFEAFLDYIVNASRLAGLLCEILPQ